MNKELVRDFQTRIVNAGRGELLIINYEMLLAQIDDAIEAIHEGDDEEYSKAMVNSHKLLRELSSGLDFQYDISKELMSIYIYVNKKFIDASVQQSEKDLLEAAKILRILLEGWKLTDYEEEAPVISNGQKVYAGLTYGHGTLNESVDVDVNRGFRA